MVQISKYPLDKEIEERIFEVLWQTFSDLKNKGEAQEFLTDLLSPTERVMIAKRLAIAVLLVKGYEYETIREILKVSTSTIGKIASWLNEGGRGFKKIVRKIIQAKRWQEFWDKIQINFEEAFSTKHKMAVSRRRFRKRLPI